VIIEDISVYCVKNKWLQKISACFYLAERVSQPTHPLFTDPRPAYRICDETRSDAILGVEFAGIQSFLGFYLTRIGRMCLNGGQNGYVDPWSIVRDLSERLGGGGSSEAEL
jgi:hypothetical protein